MFPRLVFTCLDAATFSRSCYYQVHTGGTSFNLSVDIVSVPRRHPLFNLKITFAGVDVLFLDNYPDLYSMLLFPTVFYSREVY